MPRYYNDNVFIERRSDPLDYGKHVQYQIIQLIYLRFKSKLENLLQHHDNHYYYPNAEEFIKKYYFFIENDHLNIEHTDRSDGHKTLEEYWNAKYYSFLGKPKEFDRKKHILEDVIYYWYYYQESHGIDYKIYLNILKHNLRRCFKNFCSKQYDPNKEMSLEYGDVKFGHLDENENLKIYDTSFKKYICNNSYKFDINYHFLIKLLNHVYCIIISINITNIKKLQEIIDSANKLFTRLYALGIKNKTLMKCEYFNEGMITKFGNMFNKKKGGIVNKVTKPKVKKVIKSKVKKVTKPKVNKVTKPKTKKVTKPKVKRVIKPKVTKPKVTKPKVTKPKVKK